MSLSILTGDWIEQLNTLPDQSVHCCVTSPPYWGLRDYGVAGQLGLEKTPAEYVAKLVAGFSEVRRVLRDDGTAWVNLGDSYAARLRQSGPEHAGELSRSSGGVITKGVRDLPLGLKEKDLVGIPWRVAFALQSDGWYLRSDIIWHKPNPMPESVTDRPTKAHEYIFLLSKKQKYFYDAEAIKERGVEESVKRLERADLRQKENYAEAHFGNPPMRGRTGKNAFRGAGSNRDSEMGPANREGCDMARVDANFNGTRNKRSVWTVATSPYKEAHFATFPPDLIKPCIMAGCPVGGTVLDPFFGSGTTGQVALELGRKCIGIELNPVYCQLAKQRCDVTPGLPLTS